MDWGSLGVTPGIMMILIPFPKPSLPGDVMPRVCGSPRTGSRPCLRFKPYIVEHPGLEQERNPDRLKH